MKVGDRVKIGINAFPQGNGEVYAISDDGKWVSVRLADARWPITAFRATDVEIIPIIDDLVSLA